MRIEDTDTPFTCLLRKGEVLKLPVANAQGNFVLPPDGDDLQKRRIVLRYWGEEGELSAESNPSGAEDNIAGIANNQGNVLGMMPHPERSFEILLGSEDGRKMFESVISWIESRNADEKAV